MMVFHLADVQTDAQMSSDRGADALNISHCRWQCIQGQGPWWTDR